MNDMKRIKFALTAVIVVLSIIAGLTVLHITNRNRVFDSFEGTDITGTVDEYIKSQKKEKAPEMSNAIWLCENYDVPFDAENEEFLKVADEIEKLYFDTVFLRSEFYSSPKNKNENPKSEISKVIEVLKKNKLKVYLQTDSSFDVAEFCEMAEYCDGFIISDSKNDMDKFNSKLLAVKAALAIENGKTKIFALLSENCDMSRFNKRSVHGVYIPAFENSSLQTLKKWNEAARLSETALFLGFDIDSVLKKEASSDSVLKKIYEVRELSRVSCRALSSYKAVKENCGNSFSAVETYVKKGIFPDIAFRKLGITGYDGNEITTEDFYGEVEIYGSDLFPLYVGSEEIDLGENGSIRFEFAFDEGKNEIKVSQCSDEILYKANVVFNGDILKSVTPENEILLYPKEKSSVTVVAYYKTQVTVKVGTKEYEAKPVDKSAKGYVAFTAKIKMPSTREEVASLGMITVIGSCGGKTMQLKGAVIKPAEEKLQISNGNDGGELPSAPIKIENYVPSIPGNIQQNVTGNLQPGVTIGNLQTPSVNIGPTVNTQTGGTYTGGEMALINAAYADTRPLVYNDDTYTPSCSALVKGTMDYITAQSEAYNKEYGEQVYFYELASGVKVLREDVQLIPLQNLGDNSLGVVSSFCENGTLKIYLRTLWKVPYTISFAPQSYFSQFGTKFNVSSFSTDYISIKFHHTTSAEGAVDASLSNVVSGASWIVSAFDKTATLYMPIRAFGEYYGCSVEYDENGFIVISVHNKPQTLSSSLILLDPGHGGKDPGALGYNGAVEECDINLALAYYTKQALEARGATVYSTRGGDETVELEDRKAIARSLKPDFFVSIHSNSSTNKSMIGTATYYYKPYSKRLAANIYGEMLSVFKSSLYYGRADLYDSISDGTPYYPFSVTRLDECPSVLIETGYVSNNDECYKLIQPSYQQALGEAIAKGIEKTITG